MKGLESVLIREYLNSVATRNEGTASTYSQRLARFQEYLGKQGVDEAIAKLQKRELDVYSVLAGYHAYLHKRGLADRSQVHFVKTIKAFLEYNDIEINPQKFKRKVMLPRPTRKHKLGLSKKDIADILDKCKDDARLYIYLLFLGATGCRAMEAIRVRNKDLHLDDPVQPFVEIHGEKNKTKQGRTVYLTAELVKELKNWKTIKYRERRTKYANDKTIYEKFTPAEQEKDFTFYPFHHDTQTPPQPRSVYNHLDAAFIAKMKAAKKASYEEDGKRHKVTFHTFRRFVKTTISNLGHSDYSEWFIGHVGSEYYETPEPERLKIFRKIEPYLTFLDRSTFEAVQQDTKSQMEAMQKQVMDMTQRMAGYEKLLQTVELDARRTSLMAELVRDDEGQDGDKIRKRLQNIVSELEHHRKNNREAAAIIDTIKPMLKEYEEKHEPYLEKLIKQAEEKKRLALIEGQPKP